MSKQANKTMIGVFVVGALVLVVSGILIFGSGEFLKEKVGYVMFFKGSVKGLDIGAPVSLQGVKVGTVTDILLRGHVNEFTFDVPVFIEIEPERITRVGGEFLLRGNSAKTMQILVEKGLRAQLQMQSIVTGKLMIELKFAPDKPVVMNGEDMGYPEIPTIQTGLEELAKKIEKVPIEEIFEKLHAAVAGIGKVVNSPEIMAAVNNLNGTLEAARGLILHLDQRVDPLTNSADNALGDARHLIQNVDNQVEPLAKRLAETVDAANSALAQIGKTLRTIQDTTSGDSEVMNNLNNAILEISSAARSIGLLADYVAQHPESLLRGKGESK
jgi:paraquat-inducible protein B